MKIAFGLFIILTFAFSSFSAGYTWGQNSIMGPMEMTRKEASFWRKMYLQADADAKAVNCEPLDNNYFICEKAKTP